MKNYPPMKFMLLVAVAATAGVLYVSSPVNAPVKNFSAENLLLLLCVHC